MNVQKIELLAPAGSFESLKAAAANGADSVYLGGGKHNARINADNFTDENLVEAIDYAHERGIRVYVTINTLLKDHELHEGLKLAEMVHKEGADAVIVQDAGFAKLLREYFPDLHIHASTQMTVTNSESVKFLEEWGFKRIVLARELSIAEIRSIREKCNSELEVFVHGALCVCYSGQCLMSSFIGGRSGNRGLCAQPCRLPWSLSGDGSESGRSSYLLSPRDLMALELLPELKSAGVSSLKIEGRMKSPEYVAIVTSVYRKYIDLLETEGEKACHVENSDRVKLMQAFSRGGFTRGYFEGSRDYKKLVYPEHPKNQGIPLGKVLETRPLYIKVRLEKSIDMGDGIEIMDPDREVHSFTVTSIIENGRQVRSAGAGAEVWIGDIKTGVKKEGRVFRTLSKSLFDEARKTFEGKKPHLVPLYMEFAMKAGEKAVLKVTDHDGNIACTESAEAAKKALNKALTPERIREQLTKTGDTPYRVEDISIETDNDSVLPISALNAMRRETLEKIRQLRIKKWKKDIPGTIYYREKTEKIQADITPELTAYFADAPGSAAGLNGLVKRIYIPVMERSLLERLKNEYDGELYLWTPSILKDSELDMITEQIRKVCDLTDGITYGSFGAYKALKEAFPGLSLCAGPSMNVFNNETISVHEELGAGTIVVSPELNLKEARGLVSRKSRLEAVVYGRIPLMTMEHCPSSLEMGCSGKCGKCRGSRGYLKDRKGEIFPFIRDPVLKRTRIFNAHPMLMDGPEVLKGSAISLYRLIFTDEDRDTQKALAKYYHDKINGTGLTDEVSDIIEKLKSSGHTRGHWYRGVE